MSERAIAWTIRETSLGPLGVAATPRGVCWVRFGASEGELAAALEGEFPFARLARDDARLGPWSEALVERVEGGSARPDPPLDVAGSAFQRRVWDALRAIPRGATRSYGEVAAALGRPRAARAVARACATNPVAVAIPCHRVVAKDGGIGGYAYGTWRKRALLRAEADGTGVERAERRPPTLAAAQGSRPRVEGSGSLHLQPSP
jgi:AraC family transcriptional regulator of adaptative response/methylated-DNA-[protein]-cysteine methyltransferase